jgi:hypothetical protein
MAIVRQAVCGFAGNLMAIVEAGGWNDGLSLD